LTIIVIIVVVLILLVAVGEYFISARTEGNTDVTGVLLHVIEDNPVLQINHFIPTTSMRSFAHLLSFPRTLCVRVSCAYVLSAWLSAFDQAVAHYRGLYGSSQSRA
jgi:hypothetical protein